MESILLIIFTALSSFLMSVLLVRLIILAIFSKDIHKTIEILLALPVASVLFIVVCNSI